MKNACYLVAAASILAFSGETAAAAEECKLARYLVLVPLSVASLFISHKVNRLFVVVDRMLLLPFIPHLFILLYTHLFFLYSYRVQCQW